MKYDIQVPRDYHLDVRTSGGGIETQNIKGDVRGHTSGGHLQLNSINGVVDVSTSGGSIHAEQLTGDARLHTSGGSITIVDSDAELDLRTSGGGIRLQNIEGKVSVRTSGGSIEASFHGVNHGVELRTSGGGIRIAVPNDFKATIDAHSSGGGVSCDLPLTTRGGDDRNDRNELYGDINGGGPALVARTSGGSIRIRPRE